MDQGPTRAPRRPQAPAHDPPARCLRRAGGKNSVGAPTAAIGPMQIAGAPPTPGHEESRSGGMILPNLRAVAHARARSPPTQSGCPPHRPLLTHRPAPAPLPTRALDQHRHQHQAASPRPPPPSHHHSPCGADHEAHATPARPSSRAHDEHARTPRPRTPHDHTSTAHTSVAQNRAAAQPRTPSAAPTRAPRAHHRVRVAPRVTCSSSARRNGASAGAARPAARFERAKAGRRGHHEGKPKGGVLLLENARTA